MHIYCVNEVKQTSKDLKDNRALRDFENILIHFNNGNRINHLMWINIYIQMTFIVEYTTHNKKRMNEYIFPQFSQ